MNANVFIDSLGNGVTLLGEDIMRENRLEIEKYKKNPQGMLLSSGDKVEYKNPEEAKKAYIECEDFKQELENVGVFSEYDFNLYHTILSLKLCNLQKKEILELINI